MTKYLKRNSGFTLIEILIAVFIVGIMSVIALASYKSTFERAKRSEAVINIAAIQRAEEAKKIETGSYVTAENTQEINEQLDIEIVPQYFEYRIVGVTDDDFIVIAQRIGLDISGYMQAGTLPPKTMVVAVGRDGVLSDGYSSYLGGGSGTLKGSGDGGSTIWNAGSGSSGGGVGGGGGSDAGGSSGGSSGSPGSSCSAATTIYSSTVEESLAFLEGVETELINGRTIDYFYDLIINKNINVVFENFSSYAGVTGGLSPRANAQWIPSYWLDYYPDSGVTTNTIYLNSSLSTQMPASAIASIIVHEAVHADYNYNVDHWIDYTLDNYPDIDYWDLDWLWNPVSGEFVLNDTIDQEYNAHVAQVMTWQEIKGYDVDFQHDYLETRYELGELYDYVERAYTGYSEY